MKSLIIATITTTVFALSAHANAATEKLQSDYSETTESQLVQYLEKMNNDAQEQLQAEVDKLIVRELEEAGANNNFIPGNSGEYLPLYTVYPSNRKPSQVTDA